MENIKNIQIEDYNYNLPDDKIAKYPLAERDSSKLLTYTQGNINEDVFKNVANYLPQDSLLVFNNTKVIQARMHFFKQTGARIEIFCIEPYLPKDYNLSFSSEQQCSWLCVVGNLKKWKSGKLVQTIEYDGKIVEVEAERKEMVGELHVVEFSWKNTDLTFSDVLELIGTIPIPPYLNRKSEDSDLTTYQTIYSKHKGSVAAPTAGLHFTDNVLQKLNDKNISIGEVTLHVGAGTFKPVKTDRIGEHEMHYETFIITKDIIKKLIKFFGNIIVVGTTSIRTVESIYWLGVKLLNNQIKTIDDWVLHQWEAYELPTNDDVLSVLEVILKYMEDRQLSVINASTGIMIAPQYKFKIINRLITNFHQPKSTLLLLISAIIGDKWKNIYDYALKNNFRFLSYGDSCLLEL